MLEGSKMAKFQENEFVSIKKYPKGDINEKGRIVTVYPDGRYWVANMNMPFAGTISGIFNEDELER